MLSVNYARRSPAIKKSWHAFFAAFNFVIFRRMTYFMCNRFGSRERNGLRLFTRLCTKIRTNSDNRALNSYACFKNSAFSADAMRPFNASVTPPVTAVSSLFVFEKASKKSRPTVVVRFVPTAISSKIKFFLAKLGSYSSAYSVCFLQHDNSAYVCLPLQPDCLARQL